MICPKCGTAVPEGADSCPRCGAGATPLKPSGNKRRFFSVRAVRVTAVIAIAAVASLLAVLLSFRKAQPIPSSQPTESATQAALAEESYGAEELVYDKNGIRICYLCYDNAPIPTFRFRLENAAERHVLVNIVTARLNDTTMPLGMTVHAEAGQSKIGYMRCFPDQMEKAGIETIEKLECDCMITEFDNYQNSPLDDRLDIVILLNETFHRVTDNGDR